MEQAVVWLAKYPDLGELFEYASGGFSLVERADGVELSTCVHRFSVALAGTESELFTSLVRKLENYGNSNFHFYLKNAKGEFTNVWNHVIAGWDYRKAYGGPSVLTLYSVENLALMHTEQKIRAHEVSTISDLVSDIVDEAKLKCKIQPSESVSEEFEVLRQCNVTDYTFICQHLVPRTRKGKDGGWRLFTTNGKDVRYARPDFEAIEAEIEPELVLAIHEQAQTFESGHQAANYIAGRAVDPTKKRELDSISEDETVKMGSSGPMWKVKQSLISPARSQDGLDAFVVAHQRGLTYTNYPIVFNIKGSTTVGGHAIKFPLIINLKKGQNYREPSEHRGVALMIVHEYTRGSTYRIDIHCGRDTINN